MAELVFDLASKLTEKLGSLAYEEICLAWGVKADLQKLERTMFTVKSVTPRFRDQYYIKIWYPNSQRE
ncbi:hypothetical protein M0R45_030409 [Rubus argutus]|uniref:Uncharacterized protein n=1 Tax=Rubus argutus TaxID=59490 RepID=A0AAW1WBA5_RUBAR